VELPGSCSNNVSLVVPKSDAEINLQPVNLYVVCELEDELIHYSIDSGCSTDQFELGVLGIAEDEVVRVEIRQLLAADASGELVNVSNSPEHFTAQRRALRKRYGSRRVPLPSLTS
jgi:hypothetical protein